MAIAEETIAPTCTSYSGGTGSRVHTLYWVRDTGREFHARAAPLPHSAFGFAFDVIWER